MEKENAEFVSGYILPRMRKNCYILELPIKIQIRRPDFRKQSNNLAIWRRFQLFFSLYRRSAIFLHCEAKKLHRFIFAIALSELHLL